MFGVSANVRDVAPALHVVQGVFYFFPKENKTQITEN
jgi:hypothetical protein